MFTHWEVNRGKLSRVLFQRPAHYLPETIRSSTCESGPSLIGNYAGEHQTLTWSISRLNAMSYGFRPQGQKGRTLSPLRLGTAGMTLSEQTSNTTLNTLHGVRLSFPSSLPPLVFRVVLFHCFFWSLHGLFLVFGPSWLWLAWAPFAPVGTYLLARLRLACPFLAQSIRFLNSYWCVCP